MNASLLEINPLVLTSDGRLVAADVKIEIDDNALPFHAALRELCDPDELTPAEREAAAAGLSFVKLDGDVGCIVNGAGLAMATMDLIALAGGRPANFLDVGGGVSEEAVAKAFSLLVSDPGVRSALVNIFGGIVRCDLVVRGIVRAARENGCRVPVVMRLEGTNVDEARTLLAASGLPFALVPDMETAAREAVRLAREAGGPRVSILVDASTPGRRPGHHRRPGHFPHAAHDRVRHDGRRRRDTPAKAARAISVVPVFDTVAEAVRNEGVDASVIFVPAAHAPSAVREAAEAGIRLIVCITEGIPVLSTIAMREILRPAQALLLGPNTPGVISPGKAKLGIMPGPIHRAGHVGVVSRSGTLTYEAVHQLTRLGLGQSTAVGIGGDPVVGLSFVDVLTLFEKDPETEAVVLIGEIGGTAEEEAAALLRQGYSKPVVAYVAGLTAPPGRRMGHAGAIASGGQGTAAQKMALLEAAGARIVRNPAAIGQTVADLLKT